MVRYCRSSRYIGYVLGIFGLLALVASESLAEPELVPQAPRVEPPPPAPNTQSYQKALQEELIYRINFGRADDIKILLERGASPNTSNDQGWAAVAIAADRTDAEGPKIVQVLVEGGANINVADKTGNYALINAARNNNSELVKYLISKGADYNVKDARGHSVLDIAKSTSNQAIISLIQQKVDEEEARKAALSSPENFVKLAENYTTGSCAYQYYQYYYKSGQDPERADETRAKIVSLQGSLRDISKQFVAYFPRTSSQYLTKISQAAMQNVYDQLDAMISNRNRHHKGVGTDEDMHKRCTAIVEDLNITAPDLRPPPAKKH